MSYAFSPEKLGLVEPDHDEPIILPGASRAERDVPLASTAHCTVNSVRGRNHGTRSQSESLLEFRHQLVFDTLENVANMQEQVYFYYGLKNENAVVFDLILTLEDGTRIACDVKPEIRLDSGRHLRKMQGVAWWVRETGFADEVRLFAFPIRGEVIDNAGRRGA